MSGNSAWDRWRYDRDEKAVSDQVTHGHELFFRKAKCRHCHAGNNFTDSQFHNLGIGWDPVVKQFTMRVASLWRRTRPIAVRSNADAA